MSIKSKERSINLTNNELQIEAVLGFTSTSLDIDSKDPSFFTTLNNFNLVEIFLFTIFSSKLEAEVGAAVGRNHQQRLSFLFGHTRRRCRRRRRRRQFKKRAHESVKADTEKSLHDSSRA